MNDLIVNAFLKKHGFKRFDFSNRPERSVLLAKKIIDGMQMNDLKKNQFAHLMNVQPCIVTRWLSGHHNFTIKTLFEIEEKLNIQLLAL